MWTQIEAALADSRYRLRTIHGIARQANVPNDDVIATLRPKVREGVVAVVRERGTNTLWFGLVTRVVPPGLRADFVAAAQADADDPFGVVPNAN
jgi:hypothetical protein